MKFQVRDQTVFASTGSGQHRSDRLNVLFIHGAGMDHSVWAMPSRYFARQGLNVLAVDLPGHGRSGGTALASIVEMADWVVDVLDAQDMEAAAIVGHSMGSLVAYTIACRQAGRVRVLALLGISAPMPVTDVLLDAAHDNDHAAIDMANTWSHSPGAKLGANQNPGFWMLGVGERLLETAAPGVFHADLTACNGFDPDSYDGRVSSPTLVVLGDADQMTPLRAGLKATERIEGAEIVRFPGCGHSMLSERPNDVLDALISIVG